MQNSVVQIDKHKVEIAYPPLDKIKIAVELLKLYLDDGNKDALYAATWGLFMLCVRVITDDTGNSFIFQNDERSTQEFARIIQSGSPFAKKLSMVLGRIAIGQQINFRDANGNVIDGVKVISSPLHLLN